MISITNRSFLIAAIMAVASLIPVKVYSFVIPEGKPTTTITQNSSIDDIRAELNQLSTPLVEINLKDGTFPTFDIVNAPEGAMGQCIINNEYVQGSLKISIKGKTVYDSGEYEEKNSGVRLRVRGNTSAIHDWIKKKSYKVKLSKKANLLDPSSDKSKDKDWVLLGYSERLLNFVAGTATARLCGMPWEPAGRHVNVIMNGKYMGVYLLAESVGAGSHRVDIDYTGYLLENNMYWWLPGEVYFKSNYIHPVKGWTFKEPSVDDFTETTLENAIWAVNTLEDALYSETFEGYRKYMNIDTFVNWVMSHDIMNTTDPGGSNIFIQKASYDPKNPFSTKFEAGPLWDFDDTFGAVGTSLAMVRRDGGSFYPRIVQIPEFQQTYLKKWDKLKKTIAKDIIAEVEKYLEANPDLYKSRVIDKVFYLSSEVVVSPYEAYQNLVDYLNGRIAMMDGILTGAGIDGVIDDADGSSDEIVAEYGLDGLPKRKGAKGLTIKVSASGKATKVFE